MGHRQFRAFPEQCVTKCSPDCIHGSYMVIQVHDYKAPLRGAFPGRSRRLLGKSAVVAVPWIPVDRRVIRYRLIWI